MQTTHTFHVTGMHCKACIMMIESELQDLSNISHSKVSLKSNTAEVTGDFGDKSPETIAEELTQVLAKRGYSLSVEKNVPSRNWNDFKMAAPIALLFIAAFYILQKVGLVNLINTSKVSYGTAFVVGVVASLSTCMAVVGGLLLSMSATFAKEGDKVRPQILFHIGRIVSFFILGGVIGSIGSAFQLNTTSTFILSFIIGIVMLVLGINLLDVFTWTKRLTPGMPKVLAKHALNISDLNHTLTPALVGIATFFLPCGFTQSMQIYTLSTGSFLTGGLTMLSFALGTLPVLGLISFSSFSIQQSSKAGIFFKTAGLIVIIFALFNLINSFAVVGIIPPLFNF
ncbi:MAG: sulfite exporter TauE/SafE family protein [Candidatus Peregrinibacteria bacterium]|nr:sulfite exporter TauE/SafE family protein [Candidatus Peregrinibacteria bacterium]